MPLRKFVACDARSALEQVRQALGADAVVVTSRKHADGVEIVAGHYADLAGSMPDTSQTVRQNNETPREDSAAGISIWRELTRLRNLLQSQLAGLAWSVDKRRHPLRIHVMQRLLSAGFGGRLARHISASLPGGYKQLQADAWLRQVLIRNLAASPAASLPEAAGGVWALVGPTGHGKTTTLAKLAARAVLAHGADKVGLVSADHYRLGAQQQLEAYAALMGVAMVKLERVEQTQAALDKLADKYCVLIDSAGFSPHDPQFSAQISVFRQAGVQCLLTVSAVTQGGLMEHLIARSAPQGVILTKLDEGGQLGGVLDCLMRHRIPLLALATGQRVPEDFHLANVAYVIDRALRAREHEAFELREEDRPVQLAAIEPCEEQNLHTENPRPDLSLRANARR